MFYEPLHHKYRPQTFGELVGQDAIATTLTNAITTQRIAPAYLFTGPRGTGKTSSARIFAKSLNCLNSSQPTPTPCGKCEVCLAISRGSALDTIEIDAASNTGVDNMREIIERSQFAPVQGRYKVYVIDECHMLSTAAFNSLLKTLEEPPARVVFVLATTDPQRVLPTIISRCQRFDYRRIPLESMISHLKEIAGKEKIDITDEAVTIVAQIANGGLRDAQSLLDQLSLLSGTITPAMVWDLVGSVPDIDLLLLLEAIAADQPTEVLAQSRSIMNRGREPLVILQNLAHFYLNLLIAKTAPSRSDLVAVTSPTWKKLCAYAQALDSNLIIRVQQYLKDSEVQIKNSTSPRLWLEITLLGLLPSAAQITPLPPLPINAQSPQEKTLQKVVEKINNLPPKPSTTVFNQQSSQPLQEPITPVAPEQVSQVSIWQQMLVNLQNPMTQALLKEHGHLINFDGSSVTIGLKNNTLLNIAKGKLANIEQAFALVFQHQVKVHLQVAPFPESNQNSSEQLPAQNLVREQKSIPQSLPSKPQTLTQSQSVIEQQETKQDYTGDEVRRAAEAIAKCFNGEIIMFPGAEKISATQFPEKLPENNTTIIRGRPNVDGMDEDEIDF
ncbi:MAG: DNA polymerase III subunit gamma/tau [Gomphosphaeria aponina SAG 52.96 = DSM 107014]|uniref:DNA polymerase III subunit gamma/tau n=1 Tax=Gomphosphaeria aponina SAG 52.96 = DSM 107014 TaxID=1521640 RepID=A0A941JTF4_9CHRO|nr:DNA polymerase III subunit gamma/tau [Gomphosphaeria aponina SAG 52.96 = DSM 107014]